MQSVPEWFGKPRDLAYILAWVLSKEQKFCDKDKNRKRSGLVLFSGNVEEDRAS